MKVMQDDPMFKQGAYPNQRGDGLYMDGVLVELLTIFARQIVKDNQFTGQLCSSTFGVRTGKSTLAQQMGYYYTYLVNQIHGLNIPFDEKNIVFSTKEMEKRAFKLPRYSCLILDEGEGLDEHAMSKKFKELQSFMRRSGQLNLFIIMIFPDFFSAPKFLAMNRTNFLIDVKFEGEFERGHFQFYNFSDKKKLYVKGKKNYDYGAQKATLDNGRFVPMYCVNEEKYRKMKEEDLKRRDEEEDAPAKIPPKIVRRVMRNVVGKIYPYFNKKHKVTSKELGAVLGMHGETLLRIYAEYRKENGVAPARGGILPGSTEAVTHPPNAQTPLKYTINLTNHDDFLGADPEEGEPSKDIYSEPSPPFGAD